MVFVCSYVPEIEKVADDTKKEGKKGDEKDGRRRRHNSSSGSDDDSDGSASPSRGKRSSKGGKKGEKGKAAAEGAEDGDSVKKAAERREAVEKAKAKFSDQLLEVDREVSSAACFRSLPASPCSLSASKSGRERPFPLLPYPPQPLDTDIFPTFDVITLVTSLTPHPLPPLALTRKRISS